MSLTFTVYPSLGGSPQNSWRCQKDWSRPGEMRSAQWEWNAQSRQRRGKSQGKFKEIQSDGSERLSWCSSLALYDCCKLNLLTYFQLNSCARLTETIMKTITSVIIVMNKQGEIYLLSPTNSIEILSFSSFTTLISDKRKCLPVLINRVTSCWVAPAECDLWMTAGT